jgi:hypothetical protein
MQPSAIFGNSHQRPLDAAEKVCCVALACIVRNILRLNLIASTNFHFTTTNTAQLRVLHVEFQENLTSSSLVFGENMNKWSTRTLAIEHSRSFILLTVSMFVSQSRQEVPGPGMYISQESPSHLGIAYSIGKQLQRPLSRQELWRQQVVCAHDFVFECTYVHD